MIGLTQFARGTGTDNLVATIGSIFAVAVGVLVGTQLLAWAVVTRKVLGGLSENIVERAPWLQRLTSRWRDTHTSGQEEA